MKKTCPFGQVFFVFPRGLLSFWRQKKSYNVRYFTCLFGGSALSQYLCCRNHDVKQYVSSHTVDGEFVQVPLAQLQNNQVLN